MTDHDHSFKSESVEIPSGDSQVEFGGDSGWDESDIASKQDVAIQNGVLMMDTPSPSVSTDSSSAVTSGSATLNGTVDDPGPVDSVAAGFEYRPVGATTWTTSSTVSLSSSQSYSIDIDGLMSGTDYEFRAVANTGSATDTGSVLGLTTQSAIVDDWEDADTTVANADWSGWAHTAGSGSISTTSSPALQGSRSGKLVAGGGDDQWDATISTAVQPTEVSLYMRASSQNDTLGMYGEYSLRILDDAGLPCGLIKFKYDGQIDTSSTSGVGSWSPNTTYYCRVYNIRWSPLTYDYEVTRVSDSATVASGSKTAKNNLNNVKQVRLKFGNLDQGLTAYADDLKVIK
jgi:hypothetical protein